MCPSWGRVAAGKPPSLKASVHHDNTTTSPNYFETHEKLLYHPSSTDILWAFDLQD